MKTNQQKGFTIIELIVVIAIVAVLSAIVGSNVINYVQRAKDTSVLASITSVAKNSLVYYENNGSYAGFCDSLLDTESSILTTGYEFYCYDSSNNGNCASSWVIYSKRSGSAYCASKPTVNLEIIHGSNDYDVQSIENAAIFSCTCGII